MVYDIYLDFSGQIITTSAEVTLNGGLKGIPQPLCSGVPGPVAGSAD